MNLENLIRYLIAQRREGDYWDFKREPSNKACLIHDIICLANNPYHTGDRLLIFGIDDNYAVYGIEDDKKQKEADIIDLLAKAGFASNFPDINLESVELDGRNLEVIIIKDRPDERPYYLEKEYPSKCNPSSEKIVIRAGTIYSRTRDRNTSKDMVAPATHIEKMWRQRFGIDAKPLERLTKHLLDFEHWELLDRKDGSQTWHHVEFPEFTIHRMAESREIEHGESWVRCALNRESEVYEVEFRYHQTVLKKEEELSYDNSAYFPVPNNTQQLAKFDDFFYYYDASDHFKFNHLQFCRQEHLTFESKIGQNASDHCTLRPPPPLVIFKDKAEMEEFTKYLESNYDKIDIERFDFKPEGWPHFRPETTDTDIARVKLCKLVEEALTRWRGPIRRRRKIGT